MKSKILGIFIAALLFAACSTYSTLDSSKEYAFVVDENQSTMLKNPEFGKTRIYVYRKDTAQSFNIGYLRPFDIKIEYANKKSEILASSRMHNAYFKDIEVDSNESITLSAKLDKYFSLSFTPKKNVIYCLQSEILQDDMQLDSTSFVALPVFTLVEKDECLFMMKKMNKIQGYN